MKIQTLSGPQLEPYFDELAKLRIEIFRDYPYLYEGSFEYEKKYLSRYLKNEKAVLVFIWDQNKLAGAATGLPLQDEDDFVQKDFVDKNLKISDFFYFGESLLRHEYRGQGLGHVFFDERERWAQNLGFKKSCFCAVQRPDEHPLKPSSYRPLNSFWQKRGYAPAQGLIGYFSWQDINQNSESEKAMQFWLKER